MSRSATFETGFEFADDTSEVIGFVYQLVQIIVGRTAVLDDLPK
jgi:hypothetical protein